MGSANTAPNDLGEGLASTLAMADEHLVTILHDDTANHCDDIGNPNKL